MHGDLVGKNIRRRDRSDTSELLVFDWQTAGIGAPCVDLAQRIFGSLSPDLECFRDEVRRFWPALSRDHLERLAAIGTVFRVLAALDWESQSLSHPGCWLEDLLLYGPMLADAVQSAGLRGQIGT